MRFKDFKHLPFIYFQPSFILAVTIFIAIDKNFRFIGAQQDDLLNNTVCPARNFSKCVVRLYVAEFRNWAQDIVEPLVLFVNPKDAADVLNIVNCAWQHDFTVRASGYMHNWSPLTITPCDVKQNLVNSSDTDSDVVVDLDFISSNLNSSLNPNPVPLKGCNSKTILVRTTEALTKMNMLENDKSPYPFPAVRVECGAKLEDLLNYLEKLGYGLNSVPAPGDITIAGMLAVAAHSTGIPPKTDDKNDQHWSFGSISNMVLELTAIVWSPLSKSYELKTFLRSDPETKAFLTNLGRTFVIEVTLRVIPNYKLLCESRIDISASELFADPEIVDVDAIAQKRTIASFIEEFGRVETILFPYTNFPWLKIWSVSPLSQCPFFAREVKEPYNYPFSDNFPVALSNIVSDVSTGDTSSTPLLGQLQLTLVEKGLKLTSSSRIWGLSKNLMLYIRPTTLRLLENGAAILTHRASMQRVIFECYEFFQSLLDSYETRGIYPVNGPLEIRVSGLEDAEGMGMEGAESPSISPLSPYEDKGFDICVWFNILSFPWTKHFFEFSRDMESFYYTKFDGDYAIVRPEWSKGWAYTEAGPYSNATLLGETIPNLFSYNDQWKFAKRVLNKYDPCKVFTNDFLKDFFT